MNYRMIAKIACRVMALNYFILTIQFAPNFIANLIYYRTKTDVSYNIHGPLAMLIPLFIIALLLWFLADKIAMLIVKGSEEDQENNKISYRNIAILVFAAVGLLVLANSIPDLLNYIVQYFMYSADRQIGLNTNIYKEMMPRIIGKIVQIIIGFWLLFGSKGLARIVISFRELGAETIVETKQ